MNVPDMKVLIDVRDARAFRWGDDLISLGIMAWVGVETRHLWPPFAIAGAAAIGNVLGEYARRCLLRRRECPVCHVNAGDRSHVPTCPNRGRHGPPWRQDRADG